MLDKMAQNTACNLVLLFVLMGRAMGDHMPGHHGSGEGEYELVGQGGCVDEDGSPGPRDPTPGGAPDGTLGEWTTNNGNPTLDLLCRRRCWAIDWCLGWSYKPDDPANPSEDGWSNWKCYYYTIDIVASDGEGDGVWQCYKKPAPTAAPGASFATQTALGVLAFIGAFVSHIM